MFLKQGKLRQIPEIKNLKDHPTGSVDGATLEMLKHSLRKLCLKIIRPEFTPVLNFQNTIH